MSKGSHATLSHAGPVGRLQGRVDMLEWLVEDDLGTIWGPMLCQAACASRQLPALQWLRRHGCPGYVHRPAYAK